MEALDQISNKVKGFLRELNSPYVLEMIQNLQSGKMLRSKLALNIAGVSEDSILLCAIIEMIQSASLFHDDVIDNAKMRRNKPSINAAFGDKNAIMLGDVFYSKAFFELSKFGNSEIAQIISNSVVKLSLGEILDVKMSDEFNSDESKYLNMIELKTASLIEATAKSAAILANKDSESFGLYGRNLGLAFQIIDDILDITQTSQKLGKPSLSDFKEGKSTLPYIYLYHHLDKGEKDRLLECFGRELRDDEQSWIVENLHSSGAIKKSHTLAQKLAQDGIEAIINQSCDKLIEIMENMICRDF